MGIVAEERAAAGGTARRNRPTVTTVTGGLPIASRQKRSEKTPKPRGLIPDGAGNHRSAIGITGKERAELFRLVFQFFCDGKEIEASIKGSRKQEREALADGERVLGAPRFRSVPQQTKLPG